MIHSLSELVLPTSLILLSRSQLLNNILNCRSSSILVKLLIVASKRTLIYVFRSIACRKLELLPTSTQRCICTQLMLVLFAPV